MQAIDFSWNLLFGVSGSARLGSRGATGSVVKAKRALWDRFIGCLVATRSSANRRFPEAFSMFGDATSHPFAPHSKARGLHLLAHQDNDCGFGAAGLFLDFFEGASVVPSHADDLIAFQFGHCRDTFGLTKGDGVRKGCGSCLLSKCLTNQKSVLPAGGRSPGGKSGRSAGSRFAIARQDAVRSGSLRRIVG